MRLPAILDGFPRIVLILAVPAIAFLVTAGISLGMGGGGKGTPSTPSTVGVSVTNRQPLPTVAPAAAPASAAIANRTDCNAIRGTDYRSGDERDWYQKNCGASSAVLSSSASSGGTGSSSTGSAPAAPRAVAPASTAPVSTAQTATGQRLVIGKANVDTDIYVTKMVGGDMPNPQGYFNALAYDMSAIAGLGGDVNKGNLVLSGHVDCGKCYNGGSGIAVFWSVRQLSAGDSAQVYKPDGTVQNYVVTKSGAYTAQQDFSPFVSSSSADMTIITCTGTFSGGEYDNRHVVQFKKV